MEARAIVTEDAEEGQGGSETGLHTKGLDVQVLYVECVIFDEFAAGFDVFAHLLGGAKYLISTCKGENL